MIKINLLPSEKRKAERTPLPRFFLIVVNAAALVLFAAGIAFYVLIKIPSIKRDIDDAVRTRQSLQSAVETHDRLQKELQALQAKVGQIDQLTNRGVEWWQAVNAVWDIIIDNEKVWIDDIKMLDGKAVAGELKKADAAFKDTPPYGLAMRCHVAGDDVETLTRFRRSLRDNPVLQKIMPGLNINVDWKKDEEKGFAEGYSLAFTVTLVGPTQAPAKPESAPKAAPPKPAPAK